MCIGGGYTEPPLAVASIPVDRCESQVDIQSPPSIHTSKGTQCISTESYWTGYISVSSLPPTSKELHYLRGGYYTDRVQERVVIETGCLLTHITSYCTPLPSHTQDTTSKGDKFTENQNYAGYNKSI